MNDYPLLDKIDAGTKIQNFSFESLQRLCAEIRHFLITNVSKTGGHLSSNLGVVELTVALHKMFCFPRDKIVFDVGHQSYTHKLLTGRRNAFGTLRQIGGLSGFPDPRESDFDGFATGHGSTSISVAIGLAQAKKINNEAGYVIAIVGDGAFTGGLTYEGLNNIDTLDNLIVILNDNKMSISKNVGAMNRYLTKLRTSTKYTRVKSDFKNILQATPVVGDPVAKGVQHVKSFIRRNLYDSTFFEELGFAYLGSLDGHNIKMLCSALEIAKLSPMPSFLHVETTKGKGFSPAESNPGAFHGVSAFDIDYKKEPDEPSENSFSTVFGKKLSQIADTNTKLCAITAAMKYGTGLQYFKRSHARRFFDVGMAEAHAVTFAAGLAQGGLLPVVSIYSTFLQRAYDQIIHDVTLNKQNVLFAIDRAGLVPGDGKTHQGIYDVAFLSQVADMPIISVSNYAELAYWLEQLINNYSSPRAIRYARGKESDFLKDKPCSGNYFDKVKSHSKSTVAFVSYGNEIEQVIKTANLLQEQDIFVDVYQMILINPISDELVSLLLKYDTIFFVEEGIKQGGIGEHLATILQCENFKGRYFYHALPNYGIDHGPLPELKKMLSLDENSLADIFLTQFERVNK